MAPRKCVRGGIAALLLVASSLPVACERRASTRDIVVTQASADTRPVASAAPTASAGPSASATQAPGAVSARGTAFVRHPPHSTNSDADAVDECTQVGGNYFSCRGALDSETDPVLKRYLWRIAEGQAAGQSGYVEKGPPIRQGEIAHAEVPFMCNPAKPCNAKNEHGNLNSAVSCLARAAEATAMHQVAAARAAHAHACKCDPKGAASPGYNGTPFLCDAAGRPAFISPRMKPEEGRDIVDCAMCQPERGPAACKREVERLQAKDAELATLVEKRQIPRCQTPNQGPNEW